MPKITDRIEVDPDVQHGTPVVAGTRVPVRTVLGLLGNGVSIEDVRREYYDHLSREDILACIRYATSVIEDEDVHAGGGRDG